MMPYKMDTMLMLILERLSEGDEKEKATIIKYYNSERFRVWNLDGIERAEEIV